MSSCSRKVYREGQKFGKLTLISYVKQKKYLCKCDCGNEKIVRTCNLIHGKVTSCGCLRSIVAKDYKEKLKNKILNNILIDKNECWIWQKSKHRQGYGNFCCNRKFFLAHRISWTLFRGEIPKNILVLHKCDNPPCCNPDHLFLGTDKDNVIDGFSKGRISRKKGEDHYFSKLKEKDILRIRKLHQEGIKQTEIAKILRIKLGNINGIVLKKSWKHIS